MMVWSSLMGQIPWEETAYFRHSLYQVPRSIVLTGAMRSSNELEAGWPITIYQPYALVSDDKAADKGIRR